MTEQLAEYLAAQRWYAAKSRDISHAGVAEEVPLPGGLRLTFAEVVHGAGTRETYQLIRDDGDADVLETRAGDLLELMRSDADVAGGESVVRFRSLGDLPEVGDQARGMGVEQSNSSVVLGEAVVLKAYRRVEPGISAELELTRFLTERGFANVPALCGWYEIEGAALDATLGVAQAYAPGLDGWELALDAMASDPEGLVARLRALGETVGDMHTVLGSDRDDPAFAPEEPSQEALGLLTATVDEEIERIFASLGDHEVLAPIAGRGEDVRERLRQLAQVAVGGRVIRHHGDLHLGQTLLAGEDWLLLDFEGEPARTLQERRRKRSPLRDVAAMLRSFAYAASASEIQRGVPSPEGWEGRARDAFLEGWLERIDRTLLPPSDAAIAQLLSIYELEKAIYELRYEMNSRPDWVRIPVAGVVRLLDGGAA